MLAITHKKQLSSPSLLILWICLLSLSFNARSLFAQAPDFEEFIFSGNGNNNFYEMKSKADEYVKRFGKPKGVNYNNYRRNEHYMRSRLLPGGRMESIPKLKKKAYEDYYSSLSSRAYNHTNGGNWLSYGPDSTIRGEVQGRVNRIDFHPTDPDIIYAATAGGGLWITEDGGDSWEPKSDGITVTPLTGVAVNYNNPNIIYILTGDGDGRAGAARTREGMNKGSIGVLKSIDGGDTWAPTGSMGFLLFNDEWTFNLVMHPTDPDILFVASDSGIWRTDDGADTWTQVYSTGRVYEVRFKPGAPDTLYATRENGLYRSVDGGLSWSLSASISNINGNSGRIGIALTPQYPNKVYLLAGPSNENVNQFRGLFLSNDSGANFTMLLNSPNLLSNDTTDIDNDQSGYDHTLWVGLNDTSNIAIGGIGLWVTNDYASTFTLADTHADIHEVRQNPLDNKLYAATDGGLFVSDDFGLTWTFLSDGMAISQYYYIDTHPTAEYLTLAGAQDNGTHFRSGTATTWDRVSGSDGMACGFNPMAIDTFITSRQFSVFYITTDGGATNSTIFNPSNVGDTLNDRVWVTPFVWNPQNPRTIYVGYTPIFKSTDMGQTWSITSDSIISGIGVMGIGVNDTARIYAGYDTDDRYFGTTDYRLYSSSDAGATWDTLHNNPGFPNNLFVTDLVVNPSDADEVWITCGGYQFGSKVFRTTDGGLNWSDLTGSLPRSPANAIEFVDQPNTNWEVYVGTDIGVFYRRNGMGDWVPFSNGLPQVEVADLSVQESTGLLRAATYGRGVWESDLYADCPQIVVLNNTDPNGKSYYYQASTRIWSFEELDGEGQNTFYKAGDHIQLSPGFNAKGQQGAAFRGWIGPCGAGVPEMPLDNTPLIDDK